MISTITLSSHNMIIGLHLAPNWSSFMYHINPAVLPQSHTDRRGTEYMYFLTWNSMSPIEATRIYQVDQVDRYLS